MTYDVIVVGGSYAGISAAMQIARGRQKVLVLDAGKRRNRFASHAHGILGFDGVDPAKIAELGREQLLAYPTVEWKLGEAAHAKGSIGQFEIALASGETLEAKRLVLATGVVDDLPEIPGMQELWGKRIFACPYCHGYELGGRDLACLATSPFSSHHAAMVSGWRKTTYLMRGLFAPDDAAKALLAKRNVAVEDEAVTAVAPAEGNDVTIHFASGRRASFAGLFVASRTRVASPLAAELGCAFDEFPGGTYVKTDPMKETTVPGVFACGDAAIAGGNVPMAIGEGSRAGASAHMSLIFR